MGRQAKTDPVDALMQATLDGFKQVNEVVKIVRQEQKILTKATYDGLTGSGKARFVTQLVDAYGSQNEVAKTLDLTAGRISQLVNSEKNKQNGK
jgi:hypothetical protein